MKAKFAHDRIELVRRQQLTLFEQLQERVGQKLRGHTTPGTKTNFGSSYRFTNVDCEQNFTLFPHLREYHEIEESTTFVYGVMRVSTRTADSGITLKTAGNTAYAQWENAAASPGGPLLRM